MGFTKQFTHDRTDAVIENAYYNIRIKKYDQKCTLQFCVNTFKSKESFDATFDRFESSFLKKHFYTIDVFELSNDQKIDNPIYNQYFGIEILRKEGVDLIKQCYEYLKNETDAMADSVDVFEESITPSV